jgi:ATP-binding cassette subfamily B protein RaxB
VGERRYTMQEVNEHFTGVALELWPDPGFKPREEKAPIALTQLIGQVTGFWPSLAGPHAVAGFADVRADRAAVHAVDRGPRVVSRDTNLLTTLALGFLLLLFSSRESA